MLRRIVMVLFLAAVFVGTEHCSVPTGQAFADVPLSQQADPCPPECTVDTMEIVTWYPSPWNSYEELYTMKLGVGDVTTGDGESHLRPKTVGSIKVERSVVFKPMVEDPVPEQDLYTGEYTNVETGEMIYNSSEDKFKYFNGQTWVPQGSGSGKTVIAFTCLWRYDYRQGWIGIGPVPTVSSDPGFWGCTPQVCPTSSGWSQLGDVFNDQVTLACGGAEFCNWQHSANDQHYRPVSAGRSVRLCVSS